MSQRLVFSLLIMVQLTSIIGCSRSVKWLDQRDRSGVLVQRAIARKDEGDIDSAIKLYAEALDDNQRLARAHLDIALLLHHHTEDYVRAIYHYERYLELCPQTEKRDMIENRIRIAKQSFVASVIPGDRKVAPEARITTEDEQKADEVTALKKENAALKSRLKQLTSEVRPSNAELARLPSRVVGSGQETSSSQLRIRTYRVERGDTLASIATEICKDAGMWRKIYEANRDKLRSPDDIKVGQILVIP